MWLKCKKAAGAEFTVPWEIFCRNRQSAPGIQVEDDNVPALPHHDQSLDPTDHDNSIADEPNIEPLPPSTRKPTPMPLSPTCDGHSDVGQLRRDGIFKADGSEVRNPAAFVANIRSYQGGLFTAAGLEIRDPQSFVANMVQASDHNTRRRRGMRFSDQAPLRH